MTVTLAAALAEVVKIGTKPAASLSTSLAKNKTWAFRASHEALGKVGRPRPRWALTLWLMSPETLRDVLLAPGRPGADVVRDVDEALAERSKKWRRLPADERRERAEKVALGVYSNVLSKHSPGWATRIASERSQAAHELTQGVLGVVSDGVGEILHRMAASSGGDRERLEHRLGTLPSVQHDAVRRAWEDAPEATWTLVTSLTSPDARRQEVVAEWATNRPSWLSSAPPQVQAVAAHLATAYGGANVGREMLLAAARAGAPRRQYLIARAAGLFDPPQYSEALELLNEAGTPEESPEPYVRALHAVLSEDWLRARNELDAWIPGDPIAWALWLVLQGRVTFLGPGADVVTDAMFNDGLTAARRVLAAGWSNSGALQASRFLMHRAVRSASTTIVADMREALDLAVRARDGIRTYRGNSEEAVALACQIALMSDDPARVIALGAGEATPEEAADPKVVLPVAIARASLNQPVDDSDMRRLTIYGQAVVRAALARRAGADEAPHWRAAVEAAADESERVTALAGLAATGEAADPTLDELDVEFPQLVASIRAQADVAGGNPRSAIERLRGNTTGSIPAALLLAQAYQQVGEIDNAVATLREVSATTSNPEYALAALRLLWSANRKDEIPAALGDLLGTAPAGWAGRPEALQMAAQFAADAGDLPRTIELLRASLAEDPRDADTRWALARAYAARGELSTAAAALAEHSVPLEPGTVDQAHLWLELNKHALDPPVLVQRTLGLLDRFPDSEKLAAHALTVLVTSGREEGDLPEDLLGRVRALHMDFFERWPESEHFMRYSVDVSDAQAILASLTELVSVTPDAARARREFHGQIARSSLPLGAMSSAVGKGYAELLLRRGVLGALPTWHPDSAEHVHAKGEATAALGLAPIMDTSAAVAISTLQPATQAALRGTFRRVEVVDDALVDATITNDSLGLRSTGVLTYDDRTQQARYEEIPEAAAERLAEDAEALLTALTALPRVPAAPPEPDELDAGWRDNAPWLAACRTAAANGTALWCDDAALRVLARSLGATSFSTWALIEVLTDRGDLTSGAHDEALADLVVGGAAGGLPLSVSTLLEIAEREEWRVGGAALALGNPAMWRDHQRANRLLIPTVRAVLQHRPDALPAWVYQTATGIGYAYPEPAAGSVVAAGMLAIVAHSAGSRPEVVRDVVQATRLGLASAAADPADSPDPLEEAASLMFRSYAGVFEPALAAQYVRALFTELDPEDRAVIARIILS